MMSQDRLLPAIGLRLLSAFLLGSMYAVIKLAEARGAVLSDILFFRQFGATLLMVGIVAAGPGLGSVRTQRIGAHAGRTVAGLTTMAISFAAVILLPLAESTTLQFTVPIFATILGAVLLGEPTGWRRWAAVLAGFVGVLIVVRPGGGHFPLIGTAAGLSAALGTAIVSILLRQIGRTETAMTTVFWFSSLSVPVLAVPFAWHLRSHDAVTWAMLGGIGVLGGCGQLALTGALRLGPVSVVVPMDYSSLLWATLFGWLLFAQLPAPATWFGAPVIIGSGLYIVWREHVRRRGETRAAVAEPVT